MVTLAGIDVFSHFGGVVWAVRARLDVNGRPFVCAWKFATEGEARSFAEDEEVVFLAAKMTLEDYERLGNGYHGDR